MIRKSSRKNRVKVCVLAAHPMVVAQLQRILNAVPTPMDATELPMVGVSQGIAPKRAIYILDASSCQDGAAATVQDLLTREPGAHILVLGDRFEENVAFELLNLGVKGLVTHEKMEEQLPRALETVSSGGLWVWRNMLSRFVGALIGTPKAQDTVLPNDVRMSQRERQIASALLKNLTNKEIANELHISERTVKFHVSNLLSKFKVQRRSELLLLWYGQEEENWNPRFSN